MKRRSTTQHDGSRVKAATQTEHTASRLVAPVLCVAVTLAGGAVMVIELLGTRVVAPVFGASLYVWTSLITVTLLSLTIGYPLGGLIADRHPKPGLLFALNAAAGLAILLSLLIRGPVLEAASSWGPRLGALAASLLLFTLPLVLLGTVGPFAARLFVREVRRVGLTVGTISALSAAGSIIGTIATGFVLIPHVGIANVLLALGAAMIAVGVVGMAVTRSGRASATCAAAGIVMGAMLWRAGGSPQTLPPEIKVLFEGSSAYGDVKVVEDAALGARLLFLGHGIHTIDIPAEKLVTTADMVHLVPVYRPKARRALLIGLGGGTQAKILNRSGIAVDAVEIDPLVVRMAKKYFGITEGPQCRIFTEDGRPYLNRCTVRYDVIVLDAFGSGTAPPHLLSREAFAAVKRCLRTDGLLALRGLRATAGAPDRVLPDVLHTLDEAGLFINRRVFLWDPQAGGSITSFVLFASDGPLDFARPPADVIPPQIADRLLERAVETPIAYSSARVITDDLNPLDLLQIRHNDLMRQLTLSGRYAGLFDPRR